MTIITDFESIIESEDIDSIMSFMKEHNLTLKGNKIIAVDPDEFQNLSDFWDIRQMAEKIMLNQLYGGLANVGSMHFEQRLTQSCTLTGRCTTQHMGKAINEFYTGKYELGETILYGDSVTADTLVQTNYGYMRIDDIFDKLNNTLMVPESGKEYRHPRDYDLQVVGFDIGSQKPIWTEINFIVRHRTNKKQYRIITQYGKKIHVTNDHSIVVYRNNEAYKIPPNCLEYGDVVATTNDDLGLSFEYISKVEQLDNFDNEYVYDLSVKDNDTVFFGNDILVSNTDSNYFTVPEDQKESITKDEFIKSANEAGQYANNSFAEFYKSSFNVDPDSSVVIKCAREICADNVLFIKKKRYVALVYDNKGVRYDGDNKSGKMKIMGLDIKRSDCPKWVQDKLEKTLENLLIERKNEDDVLSYIKSWRDDFIKLKPWQKGTPKRVNKLTYYKQMFKNNTQGVTIPGHVRAAINWNNMIEVSKDTETPKILDGAKTIVCKLKPNKFGINSIGYPVDMTNMPKWFINLPFDEDAMIDVAVDNKLDNIFGLLNWDMDRVKITGSNLSLFDME